MAEERVKDRISTIIKLTDDLVKVDHQNDGLFFCLEYQHYCLTES